MLVEASSHKIGVPAHGEAHVLGQPLTGGLGGSGQVQPVGAPHRHDQVAQLKLDLLWEERRRVVRLRVRHGHRQERVSGADDLD